MTKQSEEKQDYIFPDSPEAARFAENISGWVDRNGVFFAEDEQSARYSGATHVHCTGCGNVISKNAYCKACAEKRDNEQYSNAPRQGWDGKTPLYSETRDEWYFDNNDLDSDAYSFAEENGYLIDGDFDRGAVYDKMRLYLGKPHKLSHVQQDYWYDDLGEDGELPDAICEALAALNEAIDKANAESPCSWEPSNVVAVPR